MRLIITFNNKNWPLPIPTPPVVDDRFRLEALENGSVVGLSFKSDQYSVLQYSLDGTTWNNFTTSTSETLNAGDKFYIRGKLTADIESGLYTNKLSLTTGKFAAKGNIMHLYDYEHPDATSITYRLPFGNLFQACTALYDASELILPVTTFTTYGVYRYMFNTCRNLTAAPALPATTLYEYCYDYMFYGCSSLTEAPVLPAAVVPTLGYHQMFFNCSSLKKVTSYATTISASECLGNWLGGTTPNTSSCHFYNLGGANYTRNVNGIPSQWTVHTSL